MKMTLMYLIPIAPLLASVLACGVFSKSGDTEIVFAATEVGTPQGEKVSKQIGPAGGTLSSPDGRMTLTVPPNAVNETVTFGMQPISNKAENGLGLAYRLDPDGRSFPTPLEITVRYEDKDLEGTVAEALTIAYQDNNREWHAQMSGKLDKGNKTLTINTTHFTDFGLGARLRISPTAATLRVNQNKLFRLIECKPLTFFEKLRGIDPRDKCSSSPLDSSNSESSWNLMGEGTLSSGPLEGVLYTAPAKKPSPNVAFVDHEVTFTLRDATTGRIQTMTETFRAVVTIMGYGYRATGRTADNSYSGTICDLEKPFTVSGSVINYKFEFTPTSPTAGTVKISAAGMMSTSSGGGPYTIENADTPTPRIVVAATALGTSPVGSRTGSGTLYIDLVELDTAAGCYE